MTDRDIRAYLRGACADGILRGWNGPTEPGRSYHVNGTAGANVLGRDAAADYAVALGLGGVEPLYRGSEPLALYEKE